MIRAKNLAAVLLFASASVASAQDSKDTPTSELRDYSHVNANIKGLSLSPFQHADSGLLFDPFQNSALPNPPSSLYTGTLFELRHDYPETIADEADFPWKKVTGNGEITLENAHDYVNALKAHISEDMQRLIFRYDEWDAMKEPWWSSIWLGTLREPIHGMYVGSTYPKGTLTDQALDLTTYVLTYYDERAANTLNKIWGTTEERALDPVITKDTTQYAEGSVIVKFAFVTPCGSDWAPMEGAATWQIYMPVNVSNGSAKSATSKCPDNGSAGSTTEPALTNIYLMQFDIIVKDSVAAPKTGWVFSTLVYDKDAPGENAWDKMVPLGATWGNDPDIVSTDASALLEPVPPNPNLKENWINTNAPAYSLSTLGWGGRLSGPNDGAFATPAWAGDRYYPKGIAAVGCLGCHGTAQYPMTSFLLPTPTQPPATSPAPGSGAGADDGALVLYPPGSDLWMNWFQSRPGTEPQNQGSVALDYDMVTAFKAIPMWQAAVKAKKAAEDAAKPAN